MSLQSFAETTLPAINAGLNATSAILLTCGLLAIRARRESLHRACMLAAIGTSTLFLACYLLRAALTGTHRFVGPPALKATYLVILFSHMVLAAAVVPLVARTAWLALKDRRADHRRWARITLPIWLYVSVTGVAIYFLLYHVSEE